MTPRKHILLLLQAVSVWFAFWLIGLPDYFQQYSTVTLAVGSIFLSVAISLAAVLVLRAGRDETRMSRAFWLSVYFTLPLAALDALYCGWYLGHGYAFFSLFSISRLGSPLCLPLRCLAVVALRAERKLKL
jgi:hypothetical protein